MPETGPSFKDICIEIDSLGQRIAALRAAAAAARLRELADVIDALQGQIDRYQLTAVELGFALPPVAVKMPKGLTPVSGARYVGPDGDTWTGGRGARPTWLRLPVNAGQPIADFRVG